MIRFLSKRYSKKRKNKLGLKISNPILLQDGEANYPAALLNLSSTIPVQRLADSEFNTLQTTSGYGSNLQAIENPQRRLVENGSKKYTSSFLLRHNNPTATDNHTHPVLQTSTGNLVSAKVFSESADLNNFEKSASKSELRTTGETNLHVFHHVHPPRNVIQCRVEMLDGAFYHVQLPVRSHYNVY
jgi:hypothetical protein